MNPAHRKIRARRKKNTMIAIPITSMGDIAFLLIIFFILCSTPARQMGIKVNPPLSEFVATLPEAPIAVAIDRDGTIYLQGAKVPGAESVEWGVTALLRDAKTDAHRTVLFRCDRAVPRSLYQPVMEAIARGGGIIAAVGDAPAPAGSKP